MIPKSLDRNYSLNTQTTSQIFLITLKHKYILAYRYPTTMLTTSSSTRSNKLKSVSQKSTSWAKARNSPSNLPVSNNFKTIDSKRKKQIIKYIKNPQHSSSFFILWSGARAQESDPFNAFIRRIMKEKKPFFEVVDIHDYPCSLSASTLMHDCVHILRYINWCVCVYVCMSSCIMLL